MPSAHHITCPSQCLSPSCPLLPPTSPPVAYVLLRTTLSCFYSVLLLYLLSGISNINGFTQCQESLPWVPLALVFWTPKARRVVWHRGIVNFAYSQKWSWWWMIFWGYFIFLRGRGYFRCLLAFLTVHLLHPYSSSFPVITVCFSLRKGTWVKLDSYLLRITVSQHHAIKT